jgi:hypothetical protein
VCEVDEMPWNPLVPVKVLLPESNPDMALATLDLVA